MSIDKRVAERDRCEIEAEIMLGDADAPLPCLIRDISEHGACLIMSDGALVPTRFELLLPVAGDIIDRRSVELRWQHERRLGVRFDRS